MKNQKPKRIAIFAKTRGIFFAFLFSTILVSVASCSTADKEPAEKSEALIGIVANQSFVKVPSNGCEQVLIHLDARPKAAVAITVEIEAAVARLTASPSRLIFNATNWDLAQPLKICATADQVPVKTSVRLLHPNLRTDFIFDIQIVKSSFVERKSAPKTGKACSLGGGKNSATRQAMPLGVYNDNTGHGGDQTDQFVIKTDIEKLVLQKDQASTFNVWIDRNPQKTVVVSVLLLSAQDYRISRNTFEFNAENWQSAQPVTVYLIENPSADSLEGQLRLTSFDATEDAVIKLYGKK